MHRFLKLFYLLLILILSGWDHRDNGRYAFEHYQMGTTFRLVCYASGPDMASRAAVEVFDKIDQCNSIFSDYDPNSELNILLGECTDGEWCSVGKELCEVITYAREVALSSDGAFDIGVGPLTKIWRKAIRRQEMPDVREIALARNQSASESWDFDPGQCRIRIKQPNFKIDLGGIAKGYSLDMAARILEDNGIHAFLLDGGGDILAGQPPPGKRGWGIMLPGRGRFDLQQGAVATSGDTYRYLKAEGSRYSHIIDPAQGIGLDQQAIVTVRAATGMMADAWATALSVCLKRGSLSGPLQEYLDHHGIEILYPKTGNQAGK